MKKFLLFVFLYSCSWSFAVAEINVNIHDSNRCNRYFSHYEKKNKIPSNLLKAISITESGVWHKDTNQAIPWPWTINFQGKGYYYNNKAEAVAAAKSLKKQGYTSMDVGCMQINLHYHPEAFKNLEEAFEPRENIAYGANFLKDNYTRHSNWHNAVASYHSITESLGFPYAHKVIKTWKDKGKDTDNNVRLTTRKELASNYNKKRKKDYFIAEVNNKRRKSDIFIKIHTPVVSSSKNYNLVENIANKALANFNKTKDN
jgi:soluble lytic murein transglycosylase-like protein